MSSKKKTSKKLPDETSDTRLSRGRTRPDAICPVAPAAASLPEGYAATPQQIKTLLRGARIRAVLAAAFPAIAIVKRIVSQLLWDQIIFLTQILPPAVRELYIAANHRENSALCPYQ